MKTQTTHSLIILHLVHKLAVFWQIAGLDAVYVTLWMVFSELGLSCLNVQSSFNLAMKHWMTQGLLVIVWVKKKYINHTPVNSNASLHWYHRTFKSSCLSDWWWGQELDNSTANTISVLNVSDTDRAYFDNFPFCLVSFSNLLKHTDQSTCTFMSHRTMAKIHNHINTHQTGSLDCYPAFIS